MHTLSLLLTLSLLATTAFADIGDFDDYWKARAAAAEKAAADAYDPDPETVANSVNAEIAQ